MPSRPPERDIPEATVARLPVYLRALQEVAAEETATISSERLAEMAGVNAAKVRKDLSHFGSYGTRCDDCHQPTQWRHVDKRAVDKFLSEKPR